MMETMKMMQDPEAQRQLKAMMADPTFQAQAQQAMEAMKASGGRPAWFHTWLRREHFVGDTRGSFRLGAAAFWSCQ